ncbi:MAG: hypothetical protein AAF657_08900 [Acidobacteriota bacterium]
MRNEIVPSSTIGKSRDVALVEDESERSALTGASVACWSAGLLF